jgi:hypothetical protein
MSKRRSRSRAEGLAADDAGALLNGVIPEERPPMPAGIARLRRAWRSKSLVRDRRLLRAAELDLEAGDIEQVDVAVQVNFDLAH